MLKYAGKEFDMLIVILFQLFISLLLMAIMADIAKMAETFDKVCDIAWRWFASQDDDEEDDDGEDD